MRVRGLVLIAVAAAALFAAAVAVRSGSPDSVARRLPPPTPPAAPPPAPGDGLRRPAAAPPPSPPPRPQDRRAVLLTHAQGLAKDLRRAVETRDVERRSRNVRALSTYEADVAAQAVEAEIAAAKDPAVQDGLRAALGEVRAARK
jgi:hypothetical protein